MGGFTVDGCGATDKFYPIINLGIHTCPNCKKQTEFTLDEVKRKISVFYIPTATVSVKYAIMCKKCERGNYISEEEKNAILNGSSKAIIDNNGIVVKSNSPQMKLKDSDNEQESTHISHNDSFSSLTSKSASSDNSVSTKPCPHCGTQLPQEAVFCFLCGLNFEKHEAAMKKKEEDEKEKKETSICPQCGSEMQENSTRCLICGFNFSESSDKKKEENSELLPQKKFCPKCNMFYVKTKERCTICSGELILK